MKPNYHVTNELHRSSPERLGLATLTVESGVSANDRLSFTIFVALALHALIVLTDFLHEDPTPAPFTMEITLSRFEDDKKPEQADYLADTNQLGSGSLSEKARVTSPVQSTEQNVFEQLASSPEQRNVLLDQVLSPVIVSTKSNKIRPSLFDRTKKAEKPVKAHNRKSIVERSLEIAELEADLDRQKQNYAKRPRVTRVTAASTMKAVDSQYVAHVVGKIEKTGNLNFPEEGGRKLYGSPRMSISIYSDGSIKEVEVLQGSGNLILDSQTKDIIHRAGPFDPFPKNVRKERDVLELIRTFSYQARGVTSY